MLLEQFIKFKYISANFIHFDSVEIGSHYYSLMVKTVTYEDRRLKFDPRYRGFIVPDTGTQEFLSF